MNRPDRRHFYRVDFHADVRLYQGEHAWEAELVDISLKGLLARVSGPGASGTPDGVDPHQAFRGVIRLSDDAVIELALKLAHATGGQLGFHCENIDLESISHLRRLIELNTGDPGASERELSELISR